MRMIRLSGLLMVLALFSMISFAAPSFLSYTPTKLDSDFNVAVANRMLDKLTIQLSIQEVRASNLERAVKQLSLLQNDATICVAHSETELNKIDAIAEETPNTITSDQELTSLQKYLSQKKTEFSARRSECRLFVLRSNEAIKAFSNKVAELNKAQLLKSEPNYWARFITSIKLMSQINNYFNPSTFSSKSGLNLFATTETIILTVLLLFGLLIGLVLQWHFKNWAHKIPADTIGNKISYAFASVARRYIPALLMAFVFCIMSSIQGWLFSQLTYLMLFSYVLLSYFLLLAIIQFLFYPYRDESALSGLTPHVSQLLVFRTKALVTLCFLGATIYIILLNQLIPENITDVIRTTFITLLSINLISILWLVNRIPKLLHYHKKLRYFISLLLTLFLVGIIATEWLGYQQLVTFILRGIALTLILTFLALLIHNILIGLIDSISASPDSWQGKIRNYLNIKTDQPLAELFCLKVLLFVLIWGSLILMLLNIWGLSPTQFNGIILGITQGFKIGNINIIPSRILFGMLFFILGLLLIRLLSAVVENHDETSKHHASQIALAAIIGYLGFAIVLLIALLIAGLNFAGLAIIAGALSVGIGFGLQNIVNNFVSGIILLIEKPIKPGDRIVIGDTEGFVKKISIRYTQIQTLTFSDLIVPNAEIVSKQVTNLMFKDFYVRIPISVGVAYGSDTELVKKILLDVAKGHPEVVSEDGPYQPTVLFSDFGDSSLKFNLYAIIRNVNLRYLVASELRLEIDKRFRENHVTIAFPQCDVHIRDWRKE